MEGDTNDVILDRVSRCVFAEARGESYEGKIAVAWVIKNRCNSKKYGNNISEVTRPGQFATWNKPIPKNEENAWKECIQAAQDVFVNGVNDPTQGSTHFLSGSANPSWAKNKQPVVKIGGHRFYNNID